MRRDRAYASAVSSGMCGQTLTQRLCVKLMIIYVNDINLCGIIRYRQLEAIMSEPSTHIRIPIWLKEKLDEIASSEQRDRIIVVTRMLKDAIAQAGIKA